MQMVTTAEQALRYIGQEQEGIRRDALTHHDLATAVFVFETNRKNEAAEAALIDAVNEHIFWQEKYAL